MSKRPSTILFFYLQQRGWQDITTFIKSLFLYQTYKIIRKGCNKKNTSWFEGNTLIADPWARGLTDRRQSLRSVLPPRPRVQQPTYFPQTIKYYYNINCCPPLQSGWAADDYLAEGNCPEPGVPGNISFYNIFLLVIYLFHNMVPGCFSISLCKQNLFWNL